MNDKQQPKIKYAAWWTGSMAPTNERELSKVNRRENLELNECKISITPIMNDAAFFSLAKSQPCHMPTRL
jgi:hypothetical protein